MDLYPRQRTFKQPSNVQDALYADTYPTANQLRVAAEFRLERSTSPVGGILSVAVFQAARKPALSEVEGDLACSAPSHANYTSPVTSAAIKITTDSPRRPRNSYHISKPSQEAYATPRIYSPHSRFRPQVCPQSSTPPTPLFSVKPASRPAASPWEPAPLASATARIKRRSAFKGFLACCSTAMTRACASSIPRIPMEVIPTSRKRSST